MPDLGTPVYIPSATTAIQNIDLHQVLASQAPVDRPSIDPNKVDTGLNTAIAFDNKPGEYSAPLRTFDEAALKSVSGYNEFKENPTYNPELSQMQNIRGYAARQGKGEYAYNIGAKLLTTTVDSAINAFNQNFRNIDALIHTDLDRLYLKDDNSALLERERNLHPTYGTGENDDSWARFNPFTAGKSDFYGEFLPQLGFTLGTIGETVLENMAIAAVTGGAGNIANSVNTASKFQKLMKGLNNVFESATGITNFKKAMHVLNSVKMEEGLGINAVKGLKLLANGYAMYNTAAGEASFEANNTYTQHLKELKDDYISKNGFAPFGEDLKKIENSASSAAISTFGWNLPVLLGSNLVQFGNILKPFKGVAAESLEKESLNLIGKGLGKKIAREVEKDTASGLLKTFNSTKGFLLEAGSEGLEEVAQSYAATGSSEYYKDIYEGLSSGTALNEALSEMWDYTGSKSFQDDFFGGFLGGAVFSGVGKISEKTGLQKRLGFDTDNDRKVREKASADQAIDILNEASNEDIIKWLYNPDVQNYMSQVSNKVKMTQAAKVEDQFAFIDARDKAIRDLIYAGIQTGKLELQLSKLDIHRELDNDELGTILNIQDKTKLDESKQRVEKLVEQVKNRARTIQSNWTELNTRYKNKYTPGTPIYVAYEEAKKERLFARDIIEQDRVRSKELRNKVSSQTDGKISNVIIDQAVDNTVLNEQIENLQYFIDNAPDKGHRDYLEKKKQLTALKKISNEKAKTAPNYNTIAKQLISIGLGNVSFDTDYQNKVFKSNNLPNTKEVTALIKDILKLEERNRFNIAQYELLNNKPMDESAQQHLMVQAAVINAAKKTAQAKPSVKPAAPSTTSANVSASSIMSGLASPAVVLPNNAPLGTLQPEVPAGLIIEETPEQKDAETAMNEGSLKMARVKPFADKAPPSEALSTSNPIDNQYHRRKDAFLEKLHLGKLPKGKKFWNKDEVQVLIVTPNNYTKYGKNLNSVMANQFSVPAKSIDQYTPEEYAALDNASVMFLFVEKDTLRPITVEGTLLPKLDGSSDYKIQDLIYSFNESSSADNYKDARLSPGEDVNKIRSLHRNQRLKWLTSPDNQVTKFQISHGLPNMQKGTDGKVIRMQNTAQDVKILADDHVFQPEDVYIPTAKEDFEKTDTKLLTPRYLRPGRPYLAIKDGQGNIVDYQKLENSKLTGNQKGALILALSNVIDKFFSNDQTVAITESNEHFNFIKHLLFLQTGAEKNVYKRKESLYFKQDIVNQTFSIMFDFEGTPKSLTFHKGADNSALLDNPIFKTWLDNRYMNVLKPSTKKFKEFFVSNKSLKEREWDNYTEYLLSDTNPTGAKRDVAEIPLKVELYTPQQQENYYEGGNKYPTTRKQYYTKLGEQVVDDKGQKAAPQAQAQPKPQAQPQQSNPFSEMIAIMQKNQLEAANKGILYNDKQIDAEEMLKTLPNPSNYEIVPGFSALGDAGFIIKPKVKTQTQTQSADPKEVIRQQIRQGTYWTQYRKEAQEFADEMGMEVISQERNFVVVGAGPSNKVQGYVLKKKLTTPNVISNPAPSTAETSIPQGQQEIGTVSAANIFASLGAQVSNIVSEPAPQPEVTTTETPQPPVAPELPSGTPKISLRGKKSGGGKTYNKLFTGRSNYTREDLVAVKSWFSKNLPQVTLEVVNNLIKIADGRLAWGTYSDSVVKVYEDAVSGTGYHEAFEALFNGILTGKERNDLTEEFRNRKGSFVNSETGESIKYSKATADQAREEIAEEFMRYKLTGKTVKENLNIFQKFWKLITSLFTRRADIEEMFSRLNSGYYANSEIRKDATVYNKIVNIGPVELGYYLKGMTYEMVNKLFSQTKSFTKFDEGFNEQEMYDGLFNQLRDFYNSDDEENPNTFRNVLGDVYAAQIEEIEANEKMSEELKVQHIDAIERVYTMKVLEQREKFNTTITFQWKQMIAEHKKYLKQLGIISFVEAEEEEGDENDKNSNDYIRNDFKIDIKATAARSIKLLFNTIAESTFDFNDFQTLPNGLNIPLIKPKVVNTTGLVNLYDSGNQLFNVVLSQVAGINTIDGIKAKLEEMLGLDKIDELQDDQSALNAYVKSRLDEEVYKNNSIYTHLFKIYTRVFQTPESELTKEEVKQRLQFVSTFSKQKPEFWQFVSGADESYVRDELRDVGRKKIVVRWMNNLKANVYDRNITSLLAKFGKKSPFTVNKAFISQLLATPDRQDFILAAAKALGITQINGTFFNNISPNEQQALYKNLRAILTEGVSNVWNPADNSGRKMYKLDPNSLGVSGRYNDIADLVISREGDEFESVHNNIEGEQQQNIIQNNEISQRLASFNRHKTLASYIKENPEFNDTFVKSSTLLGRLFDKKGNRTSFSPKISVISGTIESSRDKGKKSSNQNLTERLYQEFNVNLDGKFYILLPADAETEWGINVGKDGYITFTDDVMGNNSNIAIFMNYLKSEIISAQQFVDVNDPLHQNRVRDEYLSQVRPLKDGTTRKVGASLQIFKDILSDELVSKIHGHIDNVEANTEENVNAILEQYESTIVGDLRGWLDSRVNETFKNLNRAEIVERKDRHSGEFDDTIVEGKNYIFYGLNSTFNRDIGKFPSNVEEGKIMPNQTLLSSQQVRNLIAFREMSYFINNVEMTKLFVGNPYFYKDILKRVKSFLSTTESSYVQNPGDTHKIDDWFNIHLNVVSGDKEMRLPSYHPHSHQFSSTIKTWVFKDHETLNKELTKSISSKFSANNATDAQSLMIPNAYREFYWKSGGKFRDAQEKQFQVEQAFERFLMDYDGVLPYDNTELKNLDEKILEGKTKKTKDGYELTYKEKGGVFEVFKPKGSGALGGLNSFDPFIWKTSVAMFNYRMVRGTPLQTVYLKMLNEGVHLLTFDSAIKVGAKRDSNTNKINSLFEIKSFEDLGKISSDISSYVHELPFKSVGLQVETSAQKNKGTIGTQTTKIILTDLFEYGIPTDFKLENEEDNKNFSKRMSAWNALSDSEKSQSSLHYRLEARHQKAIENLEDVGYYGLLDKLGIKEVVRNGRPDYEYEDLTKVYELLKEEMVKRGLSANLYDMFEDDTIPVKPLEALSNYAQASFIIMSIVRKNIVKPKLNGGQKIQASSFGLNQLKNENLQASYFDSTKKEWIDIETEEDFQVAKAESEKNGTKIMYNSSQLAFYSTKEDGTLNVMEVMIPNVFRDKLEKKRKALGLNDLSDEELINWIAKNQPKLLEGIGFRIPTQALNSIDTFRIKGFLPSYFGDTIVVPSELTTKVGSDFDVDKLNTYLNNWAIDSKGYPYILKADLDESSKGAQRRWEKYSYGKKVLAVIEEGIEFLTQRGILHDRNSEAMMVDLAERIDEDEEIEDLLTQLDEEGNPEIILRVVEGNGFSLQGYKALQSRVEAMKTEEEFKSLPIVQQNPKGALENEYFSTIHEILRLPQNFKKLLSPNNSDEFEKAGALRDKIRESLSGSKTSLEKIPANLRGKYLNYSDIVDSNKMRYNRWAFVIGKKGVGIAALSTTNHVNSQKIGFKLNRPTGSTSLWWSNRVFGKGAIEPSLIKFNHNQLEDGTSVLSGITKAYGQNIAEFVSKYVNGYVDVAKDAWILDIGAQMEIAGIFLFMERMGIDSEEVIYFLNQPVIKYYLNVVALKNSPIRNINPDVKKKVQLFGNDEAIYKQVKKLTIGADPDVVIRPVSKFNLASLKESVEKYGEMPFSQWPSFNIPVAKKEEQFLVFRQFLQLKDYANYIRASQQASNHDTANLNSLHILDDKEDTYEGLMNPFADVFISSIAGNVPMVDALRERTFVGNVINRLQTLDRQFLSRSVFRIQAQHVRRTLKQVMLKLTPNKMYSENDRRDIMDKITKITINALVLNSEFNGKTPMINTLDSVMTIDNLRGIINTAESKVKNPDGTVKAQLKEADIDLAHIVANKWINNLDVEPLHPDSNFGYLTLKGSKPNDNFEKQIWLEDFRKLKQMPFTQKLYKAILAAAIYQAGAEHNRSSLLDLIPWEDYTPVINNGLNNISTLNNVDIARMIAKLKSQDKDYFTPKEYFTPGEVNGKKFYPKIIHLTGKSKEEITVSKAEGLFPPGPGTEFMQGSPYWIPSYLHEGPNGEVQELTSVVLIPKNRYTEKMSYFTLKQQSSEYTSDEVKQMIEGKNFNYFSTILLERAPLEFSNGLETYVIFRPINTTGHRYMQETLFSNDYSKLDTHEKVNPFLVNDDALYKLLASKFGANIVKTESFPEMIVPTVEEAPSEPTTEDAEYTEFEEVAAELPQLPAPQGLIEDTGETPTPDITDTEAGRDFVDKTMAGESTILGFKKGDEVVFKNPDPKHPEDAGTFYVLEVSPFAEGYVMVGDSPTSSSSLEVKPSDLVLLKDELNRLHEIIVNTHGTSPQEEAAQKRYKEITGDDWYPFQLSTFNDLFDNPQTASRMREKANTELNRKLTEYLTKFNISVEEIESIQAKTGVDAAGVVDILNKAILLDKNKQGLDTLPEEAAHIFTMMLAHDPKMDWMKDNIDKWEGYKAVYDDYYSQYEGSESKIRFEAVGKFIALHLINNEPTVSEDIKKGIFERLWSFIKELFGDKSIITELNTIAQEIALKVLNDEALIDTKIPEGFRKVNTEEALRNNYQARMIHEKLKEKFLLTGSAALAVQGTVWRNDSNPLHDLDYISPDVTIDVAKTVKEIFPNAEPIHTGIPNEKYTTKAFLIPPKGITVREVTNQESGNYKGWITGYKLFDKTDKQVGLYETKFVDGKLLKRQEGITPQWIDVFEYSNQNDVKTQVPNVEGFSNWDRIFDAKLQMARDKDVKDWLNFKAERKMNEFNNSYTYYQMYSPDNRPSLDYDTIVEGTCK